MATITLNTDIPSNLVFSSHLNNLTFQTDSDAVLFVLAVNEDTEIYRTTLYAYQGVATLYDIRSIIESYMRTNGLSLEHFDFYCKDVADESELTILDIVGDTTVVYSYCNMDIDAQTFIPDNFLTRIPSHRTYAHTADLLSVLTGGDDYTTDNRDVQVLCVYRDGSGSIAKETVVIDSFSNYVSAVKTISVYYDWLAEKLKQAGCVVDSLLAYTVTFGNRSHSYYVSPGDAPRLTFTFRNSFNAWDTISFPAVTVAKTTVERSDAVTDGMRAVYDLRTEKTYEVSSAPLTPSEELCIEELFMSRDVRLGFMAPAIETSPILATYPPEPEKLPKILISDSTCEISDSDNDLNRVKFTWRYIDERPHSGASDLSSSSRIHQDPFTYQYN